MNNLSAGEAQRLFEKLFPPHPKPLPHKEGGAEGLRSSPFPLVGEGPGMRGQRQAGDGGLPQQPGNTPQPSRFDKGG